MAEAMRSMDEIGKLTKENLAHHGVLYLSLFIGPMFTSTACVLFHSGPSLDKIYKKPTISIQKIRSSEVS